MSFTFAAQEGTCAHACSFSWRDEDETDDGNSSNAHHDQDSGISFMNGTDEEIDSQPMSTWSKLKCCNDTDCTHRMMKQGFVADWEEYKKHFTK